MNPLPQESQSTSSEFKKKNIKFAILKEDIKNKSSHYYNKKKRNTNPIFCGENHFVEKDPASSVNSNLIKCLLDYSFKIIAKLSIYPTAESQLQLILVVLYPSSGLLLTPTTLKSKNRFTKLSKL